MMKGHFISPLPRPNLLPNRTTTMDAMYRHDHLIKEVIFKIHRKDIKTLCNHDNTCTQLDNLAVILGFLTMQDQYNICMLSIRVSSHLTESENNVYYYGQ
jgi:hypothetical protein